MKKQLQKFALGIALLLSVKANAQFTFADVKYWVGTGTDTSMLVIDFHDATWDTSYAWGYLHNSGATGEDMLAAVAAADENLSAVISGGFLNDIVYGSHSGIGGTGGFYWSTWSGTSTSTMTMNSGLTTTLANGDWLGCAYTDFSPAIAPGEPIPAYDPFYFTAQDVNFWVGSGTDTTLLVIDFLDGTGASSFAWGYLHNSGATGEQMLNDIDAADPNLNVSIVGGFLNDITYSSLAGIGGSPDYWGTFSATNLGNWDMNFGVSHVLGNGDLFGCSYMSFVPVIRPGYPAAATPSAISNYENDAVLHAYPNPTSDFLNISLAKFLPPSTEIKIVDYTGKTILSENIVSTSVQIPVHQLSNGVYTVVILQEGNVVSKRFVKQ